MGSFVWSHLTNVLRSEDPLKKTLIESLPDDIISRDFEAEFLKYSSYSDYTVASGNDGFAFQDGSTSDFIFHNYKKNISICIFPIKQSLCSFDGMMMTVMRYSLGAVRISHTCFFFCFFVCFRHGNHKCGNICVIFLQIVSSEVRYCQSNSVLSWQSQQPSRSEFLLYFFCFIF